MHIGEDTGYAPARWLTRVHASPGPLYQLSRNLRLQLGPRRIIHLCLSAKTPYSPGVQSGVGDLRVVMENAAMQSTMQSTRRSFVKSFSLAVAAAVLPLRGADQRLPIAFSTLACPQWEWMKILDYAEAHGFAAIELR